MQDSVPSIVRDMWAAIEAAWLHTSLEILQSLLELMLFQVSALHQARWCPSRHLFHDFWHVSVIVHAHIHTRTLHFIYMDIILKAKILIISQKSLSLTFDDSSLIQSYFINFKNPHCTFFII